LQFSRFGSLAAERGYLAISPSCAFSAAILFSPSRFDVSTGEIVVSIPHRSKVLEIAAWAALIIFVVFVIGFAWNPTPFAQFLAACGIAIAGAHAVLVLGWKDTAVFVLIVLVVTFSLENIGVATGVPFGSYHFEVGATLPHIGLIPIVVGPLWFGMGYFSWIVAETLLLEPDVPFRMRFQIVSLPLVAAFVMTQWDAVMDPPEATISKTWVWHDGGAHFGVPLSNYLGWLLTSWLFFQVFAIYLGRRRPHAPTRSIGDMRKLRLAAIVLYLSSGLTHLTPWIARQSGETTDATGHIWHINDLREATVVMMLFTMVFTSMLAILRLAGDRSRR
jgi:uncharacterized membrane protein